MCDIPFFPIFPICFQCGTDQNPCHCKVVGPTLALQFVNANADPTRILRYYRRGGVLPPIPVLAGIPGDTCSPILPGPQSHSRNFARPEYRMWWLTSNIGDLLARLDLLWLWLYPDGSRADGVNANLLLSVLGYPVKLNGQVSNAIPF
ncbi:hypothetical protein N7532_004534 [Penicillium argentinense]|uniref:Uncharacterized protein n=1 Tax=Penicillium argentinense TaxID=1131581 RepID=A0A9W9FPK9_9EURO|nr:uncharacterized protein N7532_004534 [Penicillium argentinense]KAJ5104005.1 hypothetical protein N7532_004534 [Penicillium argentinense]